MPKTLKQLLDQVNGEIGFDIPGQYIGNTDSNIVQIVAIAQKQAKILRDLRLQKLVRQAQISMKVDGIVDPTDDRITSFPLPSDFYSEVPDTAYQFGRIDPAQLPTSAPTWAYLRSRSGPQGLLVRCRIINGRFAVFSPDTTQRVDFEYISSNPINQPATGADSEVVTTGDQFKTDGDTWLLDDALFEAAVKWRYCQAKGLEGWQQYQQDYQSYESELRARDQGAQTIYWPGSYPYPGEPYTNLWVQE